MGVGRPRLTAGGAIMSSVVVGGGWTAFIGFIAAIEHTFTTLTLSIFDF